MGAARSKIALGTVQFGLDYGISNTQGQIPENQVQKILTFCQKHGIDTLDTAAAYGQSETILGNLLPDYNFQVVSKLAPGCIRTDVRAQLNYSLEKLKQAYLYGFLVHDFASYEKQPGIWEEILKLQTAGLIQKAGFSLYYPAHLEKILGAELPVQLVQIPLNVFDQRFTYLLPELASRNIEVHARSIFLQGLFFKPVAELPDFFTSLRPALHTLHHISVSSGIPLPALLLSFVHGYSEVSKMVIGVTSVAELEANLNYISYLEALAPNRESLISLASNDENLILPFKWKLT
jgi:aryl-alcohol dehydrogenase-like predicted oxidoreductase